jgi:hypothetical protein
VGARPACGFNPNVDVDVGWARQGSGRPRETKECPMSSPKRLLLTAVAVLVVLGAASHAQAQTTVKCNIPFEFSMGGRAFPSGVYTLATSVDHPSLMIVSNGAANRASFVSVQRNQEALGSQTLLTFTKYGTRYFLSSVLIAGDGMSLKLSRSAGERELRASTSVATQVTVLAANQ